MRPRVLFLGFGCFCSVPEPRCPLATWAWCLGQCKQPMMPQGTRMLGRIGEGVPIEGAPESLVERVVSFLAQSRALLRSARAQAFGGARLFAPVFSPASRNRLTATRLKKCLAPAQRPTQGPKMEQATCIRRTSRSPPRLTLWPSVKVCF